jgi:tetratricopeptide (TPR) repeat protein
LLYNIGQSRYNNRGITYANKDEFDKAILDFTKAIEIDPKDADTYFNRGICYCERQEYGRAILDFIKAIGINLKKAIAYILLSHIRSEQYELELKLD